MFFLKMADGDLINLISQDARENEVVAQETESEEEENPILIATNAGGSLPAPAGAAINRKRKLYVNEGKYKQRGSLSQRSVKTSVWDRIKEYPNQHLCNVNRKLWCNACSEFISNKKSSIDKHVKSKKNEKGLSDIAKNKLESQTIMECLKRRDQREHASGSTLPTEARLFRFEVVASALSGGIALAKLMRFDLYWQSTATG